MKLSIIGSRAYPQLGFVRDYVQSLPKGTVVVTGAWPLRAGSYDAVEATAGVDRAAYVAAEKAGLVTVLVSGSTTVRGKGAGLQRNPVIVELGEAVVAFWDGRSTGTLDGLNHAVTLGRSRLVLGPTGQQLHDQAWQQFYAHLEATKARSHIR